MPTIGNKLAGKKNMNPAIERAKVRSTVCLRGRDSKNHSGGNALFAHFGLSRPQQ